MDHQLRKTVEQEVRDIRQDQGRIIEIRELHGGCINRAFEIRWSDGQSVFAKINSSDQLNMFRMEAAGLERLQAAGCLRVPQVLAPPRASKSHAWLFLEFIAPSLRPRNFVEVFGRQLAETHRHATHSQFGFDGDNYLGTTLQPNCWSNQWVDFFRERRLEHQLQLATGRVRSDEWTRLGRQLADKLDRFISEPSQSSLIHGDLWSGNYLCDSEGAPVLVDPAVYYADREAEFGMIELFGGVDQRFYSAYNEIWPLAEGYSERFEIYKLYHLLNHLNLFGTSYAESCLAILRRFA